jgi:MFS family permease
MSRFQPQWLVILAGVCAALHVGKLPAALPVLRDALGVSLLQAGFLLSLVQLAGMAFGLAVGLVADGLGLRRTLLAGLWLLAAASALGVLADQPAQLLVLRAVEGMGFLLATMPAPGLIRRLVVPGQLSAALGMWSAFMPLGTALALLCGPLVIALAGWQALWGSLAVITAAMALALAAGVQAETRPHAGSAMAAGWLVRLRQTLCSRGPWLVALCFAVYSAQWMSVIGFLPSIYSQAGLPAGWTALATAAAAAVNIIGNVASGRLLQRGLRPDRFRSSGRGAAGFAGRSASLCRSARVFDGRRRDSRHPVLAGGSDGTGPADGVDHGGLDAAVVMPGPVRRAATGGLGRASGGRLAADLACHRRLCAVGDDPGRGIAPAPAGRDGKPMTARPPPRIQGMPRRTRRTE